MIERGVRAWDAEHMKARRFTVAVYYLDGGAFALQARDESVPLTADVVRNKDQTYWAVVPGIGTAAAPSALGAVAAVRRLVLEAWAFGGDPAAEVAKLLETAPPPDPGPCGMVRRNTPDERTPC